MKKTSRFCLPLPFSFAFDLQSVAAAFSDRNPLILNQAWLPEPEPDYQPAEVRTGWQKGFFCVFTVLQDRDIFNEARSLNECAWQLGDVFEIFIGHKENGEYLEFHITPDNQLLQLRFPHWDAFKEMSKKNLSLSFYHVREKVVDSRVWLEPDKQRWAVFARIPFQALSLGAEPIGSELLVSFSRYDYTRGTAGPVLSSTSAHEKLNFHRQHEWRRLVIRQNSEGSESPQFRAD